MSYIHFWFGSWVWKSLSRIWKFLSGSIHLFSGTDNVHGSLSSFVMVQSHARPKGNKINSSFEDRACVIVPGSTYFLNCSLGQSNILTCPHLFYEGEKNKNKASKIVIPPFFLGLSCSISLSSANMLSPCPRWQETREKNHLGTLHL